MRWRMFRRLYYGILGSRYKKEVQPLKDNSKPDLTKPVETKQERMVRLTGFDQCQCPKCKTGTMQTVEKLPKIRSPVNVLYRNNQLFYHELKPNINFYCWLSVYSLTKRSGFGFVVPSVSQNRQTETVKDCFQWQIIIQTKFFSKIRRYFAPNRTFSTHLPNRQPL